MFAIRFHLFTTIFVAIIFVYVSISFASENENVIDDPTVKAAIDVLDAWVQHRVYQEEIPGVSIGIVYDQQLIWTKGYGYANLEKRTPTTPSTAYRIASLTKLFTATAILQLNESNLFNLDDDINDYLPFNVKHPNYTSTPITIRMLLSHTAGLARDLSYALQWYFDNNNSDIILASLSNFCRVSLSFNSDSFISLFKTLSLFLLPDSSYRPILYFVKFLAIFS